MSEEYRLDVVEAWDRASWNFKKHCDKANEKTMNRKHLKNDGKTWKLKTWKKIKKVSEGIDGVGTKIQIYTNRFNFLVKKNDEGNLSNKELFDQSIEIWERMLHDLIAMNVDDLRDWEMALMTTNIIDINHLNWKKWKVFSDSMGQALENVIWELDIAMTAWETAVLWNPQSTKKVAKIVDEMKRQIYERMDEANKGEWWRISNNVKADINKILNDGKSKKDIILEDIEFNIGGTAVWVMWNWNKLVKLKPWQVIVYLQEKPTKNWIIWPRSNGITDIRNDMGKLVGEWWENLSFEEFLEKIWPDKSDLLPDALKKECYWLDMWDIATGKTTIFNPFVSRELLWGIKNKPKVRISSIIHVTWNPWRKIFEGLRGNNNLWIELDIKDVKLPQITEILQRVWNVSDEDVIWSWNGWVPYVIVCHKDDLDTVKEEADKNWFVADKIWEVKKREKWDSAIVLKWVWIWKSTITYNEEEKN